MGLFDKFRKKEAIQVTRVFNEIREAKDFSLPVEDYLINDDNRDLPYSWVPNVKQRVYDPKKDEYIQFVSVFSANPITFTGNGASHITKADMNTLAEEASNRAIFYSDTVERRNNRMKYLGLGLLLLIFTFCAVVIYNVFSGG